MGQKDGLAIQATQVRVEADTLDGVVAVGRQGSRELHPVTQATRDFLASQDIRPIQDFQEQAARQAATPAIAASLVTRDSVVQRVAVDSVGSQDLGERQDGRVTAVSRAHPVAADSVDSPAVQTFA